MTPIPYTLIRSDRKSIGIQITADGVVVRAPKRMSAAEIDRFVQSKRRWIVGHLSKIPAPQPKFTQTEIEALARKALTVIPDRVRHFASFEEHIKGKIVPGHFADFVVLGDDPFRTAPAQIKDIPILQTWLEGERVW